jgi:prepilin-type N-terminal cleavage/methylation domain-containing protein
MCAKRNSVGFTLVELLVAAVLLATGLAAAAAAFSAATRAQGAALTMETITRLAEAKLAEIQALNITSGSEEGDFADLDTTGSASELTDYQYRWEIADADIEGLVRAEVSVWRDGNAENPFTLVAYLPAAEETTQ